MAKPKQTKIIAEPTEPAKANEETAQSTDNADSTQNADNADKVNDRTTPATETQRKMKDLIQESFSINDQEPTIKKVIKVKGFNIPGNLTSEELSKTNFEKIKELELDPKLKQSLDSLKSLFARVNESYVKLLKISFLEDELRREHRATPNATQSAVKMLALKDIDNEEESDYLAYKITQDINALRSYLEKLLIKHNSKNKTKVSFIELLQNDFYSDLFKELIEEAREQKRADEAAAKEEHATNKRALINKPKSYAIPNSKPYYSYLSIQDILTRVDNDGQMTFLPLESEENFHELTVRNATKTKKEVVDIVSLTYSGDLDGKAAKLKSYDQSIYNGIASLFLAGNKSFLWEDVYKIITLKTKPTQKQLASIKNSFEKFASTEIRLDVSQELKNGMLPTIDGERITEAIIGEKLLYYRTIKLVTDKGTVKEGIEILSEPVLLYYSRLKGEIINIPIELLEIEGKATEETISIRDYLLREINQLREGYRNNPVINYKNLFKNIGIKDTDLNAVEKYRYTNTVRTFLESFKNKNWIKDFEIKSGAHNTVLGFKIIL